MLSVLSKKPKQNKKPNKNHLNTQPVRKAVIHALKSLSPPLLWKRHLMVRLKILWEVTASICAWHGNKAALFIAAWWVNHMLSLVHSSAPHSSVWKGHLGRVFWWSWQHRLIFLFLFLLLLCFFSPPMPAYWGRQKKEERGLYNFSSEVEVKLEWAEWLSLTSNVKKNPLQFSCHLD